MLYKCLDKKYVLRGYKDIPYMLIERYGGYVEVLDKETFCVLNLCDGKLDFDLLLLSESQRKVLEHMEEKGVVVSANHIILMEEEQIYRKANNYYIKSLHWSIVGNCNLKCRHCYMSAPDYKYQNMSTKECFRIVDQCKEANVGSMTITGGEPFLRKDILQIFDYIYDSGIEISQIYTNGTLLTEGILKYFSLRKKTPEFVLSFDGINGHDWLRGCCGSLEKAIYAIRLLKEQGFPVMIETAICGRNLDELMQTYEFLRDLNVDYWKTSLIFDAGRWKAEKERKITIEELYQEYLEVIHQYAIDGAPLAIQLDGFFACKKGELNNWHSPYHHKTKADSNNNYLCCGTCRIHPYLLPDGTFIPCASMTDSEIEKKMPNLKRETISEIYRDMNHPFFKLANMRIKEVYENNLECRSCEFWNICQGGCRAMSIMEQQGVYGHGQTLCTFFKGGYEFQIEEAVKKKRGGEKNE